jgi:hypothetical protein
MLILPVPDGDSAVPVVRGNPEEKQGVLVLGVPFVPDVFKLGAGDKVN